jgi:hypothetical protein
MDVLGRPAVSAGRQYQPDDGGNYKDDHDDGESHGELLSLPSA